MARRALRATVLAAAALVAGGILGTAWASGDSLALPKDYRSWTHVRSMVVTDHDHGMYGFHQVYANKPALRTLRSSARPSSYPEGAQFVVSIYEVTHSAGMTMPGAKRRDVVKLKDRNARATGGWRLAAFDSSGKAVDIDTSACVGCHSNAKETDSVFSTFVE